MPQLWRSLIDFEAKATCAELRGAGGAWAATDAEYARAIIQSIAPTITEAELDNLVAARMARQAVLTRASAPQFFAVVDDGHWTARSASRGVMHRQLAHLLGVAEQPHVTLRVVPLAAGAHVGLRGSFVIQEFAEDPALVFVENQSTELFLEEEADLAAYRLALGTILHAALAPRRRELRRGRRPRRAVAVRDSKHPTGGALAVTPRAWVAFTAAVRTGELGWTGGHWLPVSTLIDPLEANLNR